VETEEIFEHEGGERGGPTHSSASLSPRQCSCPLWDKVTLGRARWYLRKV
jgi:hypothetical protein